MKLRAYAKINLSLRILGKRPDGYHEIESVMQSVSLSDFVTLSEIPSGIQLITTNLRLPTDNRNFAWRAAELYLRTVKINGGNLNKGIKIHIEKNIPLAAGLAGGSADAAAVLYGLNKMFGSPMSANQLLQLGAEVGSDVPFCLTGGNCTVRGRGEQVERNLLNIMRRYILVVPELEISAKWAYEAWDKETSNFKLQTSKTSKNDLEPVVVKKYPVIQKVKERLLELGCSYAQMSGSGPAVFGIVSEDALGEKIISEIRKDYVRSYYVTTAERGVEEVA